MMTRWVGELGSGEGIHWNRDVESGRTADGIRWVWLERRVGNRLQAQARVDKQKKRVDDWVGFE
jgi:hypothetical protein